MTNSRTDCFAEYNRWAPFGRSHVDHLQKPSTNRYILYTRTSKGEVDSRRLPSGGRQHTIALLQPSPIANKNFEGGERPLSRRTSCQPGRASIGSQFLDTIKQLLLFGFTRASLTLWCKYMMMIALMTSKGSLITLV